MLCGVGVYQFERVFVKQSTVCFASHMQCARLLPTSEYLRVKQANKLILENSAKSSDDQPCPRYTLYSMKG